MSTLRICAVLALGALLSVRAEAGVRPRYGGELRVVAPDAALKQDPAAFTGPADLAVARLLHEPLLTLAADGALAPGLAAVPNPLGRGEAFKVQLRPGARFHGGAPVTARDVVASLSRLSDPNLAWAYGAAVLPLASSGGLVAVGEGEVHVALAFPYPDWPLALAHPATAVLRGGRLAPEAPVGAGPFALEAGRAPRLIAFLDAWNGRPFADAIRLVSGDARAAERAFGLGSADLATLSLANHASVDGLALFATYLALNPARLGGRTAAVRKSFEGAVDPADLTRFFVRGGAAPLYGLLPPALDAESATRPPRPGKTALPGGTQLVLLSDAGAADQRAVAERIQLKLHDAGAAVQARRLPRTEYQRALVAGEWDAALVTFAALPEPGLALAQLVAFAAGRDAAREELKAIGAGASAADRRRLASSRAAQWLPRLPLVPLYVQVPRLALREGVAPVSFDGAGVPSLGDAWFVEVKRPR